MTPEIGIWYELDDGKCFEVVAFDKEDECIEIQYLDGTVETIGIETWEGWEDENDLREASAPDDGDDETDCDPEGE